MDSISKRTQRAWERAYFNQPGREAYLMDAFERVAFERGQRMREREKEIFRQGRQSKQTLGEATGTLFALAGGVVGGLAGLALIGSGNGGWLGALGLFVAGIAGGVIVHRVLAGIVSKIRMSLLWSRGRDERDATLLILVWDSIVGTEILPHLVAEVADQGRAWTMDRKGTFYLRTHDGKTMVLSPKPDGSGVAVTTRGGRFEDRDAYRAALAHLSAGQETITLTGGGKSFKRLMWAAAQIAGIEVEEYSPDQAAVVKLQEMRGNPKIEAVVREESQS